MQIAYFLLYKNIYIYKFKNSLVKLIQISGFGSKMISSVLFIILDMGKQYKFKNAFLF